MVASPRLYILIAILHFVSLHELKWIAQLIYFGKFTTRPLRHRLSLDLLDVDIDSR